MRYVDWLFPGILGMNMMFSCLFGVGYVVLRYRKNGFLKRLHATPLSAFEFLSAQVLSRLGLTLLITLILYVGVSAIIDFHSAGSNLLLIGIAVLGALSLIALGLTIAARFSSEELVGGLLNLLTWPMMLLSGIWFSLEGSPQWVQAIAQIFPLTHVLDAARAVMLDGAGLAQIAPHLLYLLITTLAFLAFGAWSFRWRVDSAGSTRRDARQQAARQRKFRCQQQRVLERIARGKNLPMLEIVTAELDIGVRRTPVRRVINALACGLEEHDRPTQHRALIALQCGRLDQEHPRVEGARRAARSRCARLRDCASGARSGLSSPSVLRQADCKASASTDSGRFVSSRSKLATQRSAASSRLTRAAGSGLRGPFAARAVESSAIR